MNNRKQSKTSSENKKLKKFNKTTRVFLNKKRNQNEKDQEAEAMTERNPRKPSPNLETNSFLNGMQARTPVTTSARPRFKQRGQVIALTMPRARRRLISLKSSRSWLTSRWSRGIGGYSRRITRSSSRVLMCLIRSGIGHSSRKVCRLRSCRISMLMGLKSQCPSKCRHYLLDCNIKTCSALHPLAAESRLPSSCQSSASFWKCRLFQAKPLRTVRMLW